MDAFARLRRAHPAITLLTDPADCYAYAYDNSRKYSPPQAVALPKNTQEVAAVLAFCQQNGVIVTPRGRGTGTAGGSIPVAGGLVLSTERMRRILHFDPANRVMQVEAGVLNQEVQQQAATAGFFWPPDPSSAAWCSVGGNLATNAGGPHAVKYGVTRDHVLGLTAVTMAGQIMRTGVYTTKGVVGYDLTRLLIGSEGTLAIITEATLKLSPQPAARAGVVASFVDAASCARAIAAVMAQAYTPSALEFLDAGALGLIRTRHPDLLPAAAQNLLMIEVDGAPAELPLAQASISQALQNSGVLAVEQMAEPERLWAARKALSPLLKDIAPKKINEDVVVPVSCLPEFLAELTRITQKYQLKNINFGHAGNGNLHVNLLVDADCADEMARAEPCLAEIFALVLRLKGTLSGEHGVGQEKRPYVGAEIDANALNLMHQIKQVFDPDGLLNPGKVLPPESKG